MRELKRLLEVRRFRELTIRGRLRSLQESATLLEQEMENERRRLADLRHEWAMESKVCGIWSKKVLTAHSQKLAEYCEDDLRISSLIQSKREALDQVNVQRSLEIENLRKNLVSQEKLNFLLRENLSGKASGRC
ncbi:hypothetical protein PQR05_36375 [Paraburkholderia sediminicola]|uniref:hypothetical protein n=1 Tax=Paraburkholderia sediminicola TaxID=458836 RepID=UPI0038BBD32A